MNKEERRIIAEKHFNEMQHSEIKNLTEISKHNSKIYGDTVLFHSNISVIDSTAENALLDFPSDEKIPCILNFASFTRPGGGFIKGSIAQEEALCHVSNLYNILLTFKDEYDKNYNKPGYNSGLYDNWAIYSPDVYFNIDGVTRFANVITCAAPNYSVYKTKSNNINLYNYILHSRIKYILDIARDNNQENLILGAFGCGVFGNDPHTVARYFKETLENHKFKNVIFAIPDSSNGNYEAFKKVFQ